MAESDVHTLSVGDKTYILVGTAHISKQSVDLVRETILAEKPDAICLELDEKRYSALVEKNRWQSLNFLEVLKKKQMTTLFTSLVLASYQKKLSEQTGVEPGSEMLEGDRLAKENSISVHLCDRDARVTLKRAWRLTPFWKKTLLMGNIIGSLFDKNKVTEESLEQMRNTDALTEMIQGLGKSLPQVKTVLIDERDEYIATRIQMVTGKKILAVIGAGHLLGIESLLKEEKKADTVALEVIPPPSLSGKVAAWSIPVFIILAIGAVAHFQGFDAAKANIYSWIFFNSVFCAAGGVLALAHPLTILAGAVAAPITSLLPFIGAGYVTAFVQILLAPPKVSEIQSVSEDFHKFTRWWKNRALRIFLAFILPALGSAAGTWVAGYDIVSNIF